MNCLNYWSYRSLFLAVWSHAESPLALAAQWAASHLENKDNSFHGWITDGETDLISARMKLEITSAWEISFQYTAVAV